MLYSFVVVTSTTSDFPVTPLFNTVHCWNLTTYFKRASRLNHAERPHSVILQTGSRSLFREPRLQTFLYTSLHFKVSLHFWKVILQQMKST